MLKVNINNWINEKPLDVFDDLFFIGIGRSLKKSKTQNEPIVLEAEKY